MLQSIKEHSGSWFIKAVLVAIGASFVFFGVGDLIRGEARLKGIATVDGEKIPLEFFKHKFQETLNRIQANTKEPVKPELIEALGLHKQVLNGLIQEELLKHFLTRSKLVISDQQLKNQIQAMDIFKNESGRFDKSRFDTLLRNMSFTEDMFLRDVRQKLMLQQVLTALSKGYKLPKFYTNRLFEALYTSYDFAFVSIPLSKVKVETVPTTEELKTFYEQNKEAFRKKEQRDVDVLIIDTKAAGSLVSVSQEEVLSRYEERKQEFTHPEKRYIQAIKCLSKELANDARVKILAKERLSLVAKDVKGTVTDLGEVNKSSLKEDVRDMLFSQEVMIPSEPVLQGQEWTIYVVTQIVPETVQPFLAVKEKVEKDILLEKTQDKLYSLRAEIEDRIASGESLENLSKAYTVKLESRKNLQQEALPKDDSLSIHQKPLLEKIFSSSENKVSDCIDLEGGAIGVIMVKKITPSFVPEFEQDTDSIKKLYLKEQQLDLLSKDLQDWTADKKSIVSLEKLAKTYNVTTKELKKVSRMGIEKNEVAKEALNSQAISQMFSLPGQDHATFAKTNDGFVVILRVKKNEFKQQSLKKEYEAFQGNMGNMVDKDFESSFVEALHHDFKVEIDDKALESVLKQD